MENTDTIINSNRSEEEQIQCSQEEEEEEDDYCDNESVVESVSGSVAGSVAESVAESITSATSVRQELHKLYRTKVKTFFSKRDNYVRLERFVYHKDQNIGSIFLFFVTKHCNEKLIHTIRSVDRNEYPPIFKLYCPKDEYTRALRKYQKCFYNFEDKCGSGDIYWEGIRNPRFHVAPELGPISLPIAKLVAYMWAIDYGFDTVFWERYPEIKQSYQIHTTKTKRKYTEAHKRKKKRIRQEEEERIIKERENKESENPEEENENKKRKRRKKRTPKNEAANITRPPTRLSRQERKIVAERIKERNLKEAALKRDQRKRTKKRKSFKNSARTATTVGNVMVNF